MRYSKQHQEATKSGLQRGVSRAFRKHGYAGVGVDGLAKEAGTTSGAFYGLFDSKDDAFRFAVETGMQELLDGIRAFKAKHGHEWFDAFASWYLSDGHRKDLACGCALVTLSAEVTRSGKGVRSLYSRVFSAIVDEIAQGLVHGSLSERQGAARAILALLVGAVTISRSMNDEASAQAASASALVAVRAMGRGLA